MRRQDKAVIKINYIIAMVFLVVIANIYFWFKRTRNIRKRVKRSVSEAKAAELRHAELQRRFTVEQEEAAIYLKKREETWALYDQVRRQAASQRTVPVPEIPESNK